MRKPAAYPQNAHAVEMWITVVLSGTRFLASRHRAGGMLAASPGCPQPIHEFGRLSTTLSTEKYTDQRARMMGRMEGKGKGPCHLLTGAAYISIL